MKFKINNNHWVACLLYAIYCYDRRTCEAHAEENESEKAESPHAALTCGLLKKQVVLQKRSFLRRLPYISLLSPPPS